MKEPTRHTRGGVLIACITLFWSGIAPAQTVINDYAKVTDFPPCNPCAGDCNAIEVTTTNGFNVGDKVLIIQMQGASATETNDPTFGEISSYGNAGNHEKATIASISGNQITFTGSLNNPYDVAGNIQIVSIPQYTDYTVPAGGIVPDPWDGDVGGVLIFEATGTVTLDGDIDASEMGFRGGTMTRPNPQKAYPCDTEGYVFDADDVNLGADKGEGIAIEIDGLTHGKGPWSNGGGGGNSHNGGGGGGSNAGQGGKGAMEYGGCGGNFTSSLVPQGLPGNTLDNEGGTKVFLGGGGGAGHENNNGGTAGANGGGIVIITANEVTGTGVIRSNGETADQTGVLTPNGNDAGGGGGAGGSIHLEVDNFTGPVTIEANGGDGGDVDDGASNGCHPPGGGGGGGLIGFTLPAVPGNVTANVNAGEAGVLVGGGPCQGDSFFAEAGAGGLSEVNLPTSAVPPTPTIDVNLGPDVDLCSPTSATITTGLDPNLYDFVWYRDGQQIAGETGPELYATAAGDYQVEVSATGCPNAFDDLTITTQAPSPVDAEFCAPGGQDVTLQVTGGDAESVFVWYDSETDGDSLGTGTSFTLENISTDSTVWVADVSKQEISGIGPTDQLNGFNIRTGNSNTYSGFNAFVDFTIDSVTIFVRTYNTQENSMLINLRQAGNPTPLASKTLLVTGPCNCTQDFEFRFPLGFDIPAGNGYFLEYAAGGVNVHWDQTGATYPYTVPGIMEIYGAVDGNGSTATIAWAPNSYGFFYDWAVSTGKQCDRIPVRAIENCAACEQPATADLSPDGPLEYCGPGTQTFTATSTGAVSATFEYEFFEVGTGSLGAPATTATYDATADGQYFFRVTDPADGATCFLYSDTVQLTFHPLPTVTLADATICPEGSTTLDATTFTSYLWSTGANTQTVQVADADDYHVTITDANGCNDRDTMTLSHHISPAPVLNDADICQGETLTLDPGNFSTYLWSSTAVSPTIDVTNGTGYSVTVTDANGCVGADNMSLTINSLPNPTLTNTSECFGTVSTLDPGTFSSYLWSNAATDPTLDVLTSGTYHVTVTDANGCSERDTMIFTSHPLPTPTLEDSTVCFGINIPLDPGTYDNYLWSNGATTQVLGTDLPGNWSVTVTDANGCSGSADMTFTVNALPEPTLTDQSFCDGETVTASPGAYSSYLWSNGASTSTVAVSTTNTLAVTVTDANGCVDNTSADYTSLVNPDPILGNHTLCDGASTDLNPGTFTSYLWSDASTDPTLTVSVAGDYHVTVTDANGCIGADTMSLAVEALPTVNIQDIAVCEDSTVVIDAGGFNGYLWSTGATTQTISPTTSGQYRVTVSSGLGCEDSDIMTLTLHQIPSPVVPNPTICPNTSTTPSLNGFNTYQWSNGSTTNAATYSTPGDHWVTVGTINNCFATDTFTISTFAGSEVTLRDTAICDGETVNLSAPGFANYAWSDGSNADNVDVSTSGLVSVTITDANGCVDTSDAQITVEALPVVQIDDAVICQDSTFTLSAGTHSSYLWSTGANTSAIAPTVANTYSVTVTNAAGCSAADDMNLVVNVLPTSVITVDPSICLGQSATFEYVNTGTGPFNLTYSDGAQTYDLTGVGANDSVVFTPPVSATLTLVSISDQLCTAYPDESVTVQVKAPPTFTFSGDTNICLTDTVPLDLSITGTGPFTAVYSDGISSFTATGLAASNELLVSPIATTTYTLNYVVDGNMPACTTLASPSTLVEVSLIPALEISGDQAICPGDSAYAEVALDGNGPFIFRYAIGNDTTTINTSDLNYSIGLLPAADLSLVPISVEVVGDACLGGIAGGADITVSPLPTAEWDGTHDLCLGDDVDVTVSSTGTGPFDLVYSNGANNLFENGAGTSQNITLDPLVTTTYTLNAITDNATGCSNTLNDVVQVNIQDAPSSINVTRTCAGDNSTYTVEFDIVNGDQLTWDVTSMSGTLAGGHFTSDPIANTTSYEFIVSDQFDCDPDTVAGLKECNCTSDAGTMITDTLQQCVGNPGFAAHLGDEVLDSNDVMLFALHDNNGPVLGTVYAWDAMPSFQYADTIPTNTYLYISAVVGTDDGSGGIDLTDNCLSVSPGRPVIWLPLPEIGITGDTTVCLGQEVEFSFNTSGLGPFTIDLVYPDSLSTLTGVNNGFGLFYTPTSTADVSISAFVSESSGCSGEITNITATAEVVEPVEIVNLAEICDGTNTLFQLEIEVDAKGALPTLSGVTGSFIGNDFSSDWLNNGTTYAGTITGHSECPDLDFDGQHICECTTDAGTMDTDTIRPCIGDNLSTIHLDDHTLDANDTLQFILYSGSNQSIDAIIAQGGSSDFNYTAVIQPGITYYVSAVAGNIGTNGKVDFADPCFSLSVATPVIYQAIPELDPVSDIAVCPGTTVSFPLTATGQGPFEVWYSVGSWQESITLPLTSGNLTMLATNSASLTIDSIADQLCSQGLDIAFDLIVSEPITTNLIPLAETCFGLCDGTAVAEGIQGTNNALTYTWLNTTGDTLLNGVNENHLTDLCPDDYIIFIKDSLECYDSTTFSVEMATDLVLTLDSAVDPLCFTSADGMIEVSTYGGAFISPYDYTLNAIAQGADSVYLNLTSGNYLITVADDKGCMKDTAATLTAPDPITFEASHNTITCPASFVDVTLQATGGVGDYYFEWDGNTQTTATDDIIEVLSDTTFNVRAFDGNDCPSTLYTGEIRTHQGFMATASSLPDPVCQDAAIVATTTTSGGLTPFEYDWQDNGSKDSLATYTAAIGMSIVVTVTDACDRDTSLTILPDVRTAPEAALTWDTVPSCTDIALSLENLTVMTGAESCLWRTTSPHGEFASCSDTAIFFTEEGKSFVELVVVNAAGCRDSAIAEDVNLALSPQPIADFTYPDLEFDLTNSDVQFTNLSQDAISYVWFNDGDTASIEMDPLMIYVDDMATIHTVCLEATSDAGCVDTTCQFIPIAGAVSYYVPEAFSPNGDGINDGFFPVTLGFEYYEFLIYDRWGELIFKGNKEQPTWDGYLDGIPVKYDVYTWKLVGESPYVDKVIRSTGRVTVLR